MSAVPYPDKHDPRNTDYYAQEDVHDAPENALSAWRAQQRALHGAAAASAERIQQLEWNLGGLYQDAEARRDEVAMRQISDAWGRAQQLYTTLTQLDAAVAGAGETIKALNHQREVLAHELESLTRAIEYYDTHDPRLADFASEVRDDAYEASYNDAYEEAAEAVYEDRIDTTFSSLSRYGFTARHILALLDVLNGEIELDPQQAEWLLMFCDSLPREEEDSR